MIDEFVLLNGRVNDTQSNIANITLFGGGSVMVWGGISLTTRTVLVVLNNGNFNAELYILNILEKHVVPFVPYIGEDFLLIQDPTTARVVRDYLLEVGIETMAWSARSFDLNQREHVWDMLG